MIEVRKIKVNEFDLYKSLRIRALTEAPHAFGGTLDEAESKSIDWYRGEVKMWSESENSTIFIALKKDFAIGLCGAFFENKTGRAFICSMWVDPEFRKYRIGNNIVEKASSWLRERGGNQVHAWVAQNNMPAISFYKSLGFVATNEKEILPSNPSESDILYINN